MRSLARLRRLAGQTHRPTALRSLQLCRHAHVQAVPSSAAAETAQLTSNLVSTPDAVFEVLGNPYSLLSVALSPSQQLHTRRGTLVSLSGDPATTVSTLRPLSPLRLLLGIPFLYQRLTTTAPVTALISPRATNTSIAVLHLSGTTDWSICRRTALLAWTGSSLIISPRLNDRRSLTLTHLASTGITGRGLVALEGKGNIFSVDLAQDESYVVHPSNVIAYSIPPDASAQRVQPFRFKSSRLSVPSLYSFAAFFPNFSITTTLKDSRAYQVVADTLYQLRTFSRRVLWGDRLFLRFSGPMTLLIQSRGGRLRDVLNDAEVNEIADAPPGAVAKLRQIESGIEINEVADASPEAVAKLKQIQSGTEAAK